MRRDLLASLIVSVLLAQFSGAARFAHEAHEHEHDHPLSTGGYEEHTTEFPSRRVPDPRDDDAACRLCEFLATLTAPLVSDAPQAGLEPVIPPRVPFDSLPQIIRPLEVHSGRGPPPAVA